MGIDAEGEEIRDHMKNIAQVLLDDELSVLDRVRLIVLYIMIRNGISEENFHKLAIHGQIEEDHCSMIQNMSHLGVNITSKVHYSSLVLNFYFSTSHIVHRTISSFNIPVVIEAQ